MSKKSNIDIIFVNSRNDSTSITLSSDAYIETKKKKYFINVVVNFLIYLLTFSFFYFLKKKTLYVDADNLKLLGSYLLSLSAGALLSKKFNFINQFVYGQALKQLYLSLLISLGSLIILLNLFEIQYKMPVYILAAMFSGLVIESYYFMILNKYKKKNSIFFEFKKSSYKYLILDALILSFFCYVWILKPLIPGKLNEQEFLLLTIIYIVNP